MKLDYIALCGFRGYQRPVRFDFSKSFTVVDGRNGVGKSTIFDAVEFALTGTISKYLDAKASGESVDDYIWWSGSQADAPEQYVEVGFRDQATEFAVRRTPRDGKTAFDTKVQGFLFNPDLAPKSALAQLCGATIIRDEHIARLSLDLKEGDRFALLRDAIGAVDAEEWISRAQRLHSSTNTRLKSAQLDAEGASAALMAATRQIDQARSSLPVPAAVREASSQLQDALRTSATDVELADLASERLSNIVQRSETLEGLSVAATEIARTRTSLPDLDKMWETTAASRRTAEAEVRSRRESLGSEDPASSLSEQARQLEQLVALGHSLGLHDTACPLCATPIDQERFERGMAAALSLATALDEKAVERSRKEREIQEAELILARAGDNLATAQIHRDAANAKIEAFEAKCVAVGVSPPYEAAIAAELGNLAAEQLAISTNVRVIESLSFNRLVERTQKEEVSARERVAKAQEKLGRARLAEVRAKAIFDAARRASSETLDERLDRVLPLMSELYRRLRPHPIWDDIEYRVRGDIRRFLTLRVGEDVNPQFVFSSGQRRATGLAFLLSVNLSIAWSRWQSILLDDPVQHVDDFRTVHLSEVLSQLCAEGRQIICAVEDSALAELLCRRLPSTEAESGKHITLGTGRDGALMIAAERKIPPLAQRVLSVDPTSLSA